MDKAKLAADFTNSRGTRRPKADPAREGPGCRFSIDEIREIPRNSCQFFLSRITDPMPVSELQIFLAQDL